MQVQLVETGHAAYLWRDSAGEAVSVEPQLPDLLQLSDLGRQRAGEVAQIPVEHNQLDEVADFGWKRCEFREMEFQDLQL
ncbi:MAG: hypothetical protein OXL34_14535 [Gemmatimonadota bacterium]|nr:hypothetical protein [Gemmatimonadota bacterium]